MNTKFLFNGGLLVLSLTLVIACGNKKTLNSRIALNEVAFHLESNPVYETADLDYGEVRFQQRRDSTLLASYQLLESYGYVRLELQKEGHNAILQCAFDRKVYSLCNRKNRQESYRPNVLL